MSGRSYDLVILGAGPAGYVAAVRAVELGFRVAVVEGRRLGGECTNWGCIPSKAIINAAKLAKSAKLGRRAGVSLRLEGVDPRRVLDFARRASTRSREGVKLLLSEVDIYEGFGRLAKGGVAVGDKILEAKRVLVATGTDPAPVPGVEFDGEVIISNREFFEAPQIPSSILIIGAGAIGAEIGQALARLGTKVTIVEIMERPLPYTDPEAGDVIARALKKDGVKLYTSSKVAEVRRESSEAVVRVVTPKDTIEVRVEKVLIAAGRRPNTSGIGLEEAGVELAGKGWVITNDYLQTSNPAIYAAGDVAGPPYLAHKAYREAIIAVEHAAGKEPWLPRGPVPSVIFTDPEVGYVGLTEAEARKAGLQVATVKYPYTALPKDYTTYSPTPTGFLKLVYEEGTGRILGAVAVGNSAAEIIHEVTLAITNRLTIKELAKTIHSHPTYSEAVGEAAYTALGMPIHGKEAQ